MLEHRQNTLADDASFVLLRWKGLALSLLAVDRADGSRVSQGLPSVADASLRHLVFDSRFAAARPGASFVGVGGRGALDEMQGFIDDTETVGLPHVADLDGAIWQAFGVYAQPAFAFIDDSGDVEVFIGGLGEDALAERIDDLLA